MGSSNSCAVLIVLLLGTLAPALPAAAQGPSQEVVVLPGDALVTGHETWTQPRDVPGVLFIRSNASLTIQGARVTIGQLGIEPNGSLILVSQPGAPATLAASKDGWKGLVAGSFEARGLPDAPVVVDGVGGSTSRQENNVIFQGGLYLSGNSTLHDFVLSNYTSGMYVSHGGRLEAQRIRFDSPRGGGLIVADGTANVTDASFLGPANVYATRLAYLDLAHATFDSPPTAIQTSAIRARIQDVRVGHASASCVEFYGGAMSVDGLECPDYRRVGIRASLMPPLKEAVVDVSNVTISTANATRDEGHGIYFEKLTRASITNATLGPLPGNGLIQIKTNAAIDGLVIREPGLYGEVMVDAPEGATIKPHYNGTPGRSGWFEAKWQVVPRVLLADGSLATNATVAYYYPGNETPIHAHTVQGPITQDGPTLLGLSVLPNGTRYQFQYVAVAKSEDLLQNATVKFVPDGKELLLQLRSASAPAASTPAPPATSRPVGGLDGALLVVALVLCAAACRPSRRD